MHPVFLNSVLGNGPSKEDVLYGLYSQHFSRILITYFNYDIISEVAICLSSKINVEIYKISDAKNWQENLIDNSVCYNWAIKSDIQRRTFTCIQSNLEFLTPIELVDHGWCHPSFAEIHHLSVFILWALVIFGYSKNSIPQTADIHRNNQSIKVLDLHDDHNCASIKKNIETKQKQLDLDIQHHHRDLLKKLYWIDDHTELDKHTLVEFLSSDRDVIMLQYREDLKRFIDAKSLD